MIQTIVGLVGVLCIAGLYVLGDRHGAERVQGRFDAYVAAQKAEAAKTEGAWRATAADAEARAASAEASRKEAFAQLRRTIHAWPTDVAAVPVPAVAVGLLDEARHAADPAGPAPGAHEAPAQLAAVAAWMTEVLAIHAECRDMVEGWQEFYQRLRRK